MSLRHQEIKYCYSNNSNSSHQYQLTFSMQNYVVGSALSTLHVLVHLILRRTFSGNYQYYPYSQIEELRHGLLTCPTGEWQSQALNASSLTSEAVFFFFFLGVRGLHCCVGFFFLVVAVGAALRLPCVGFSLQWLLLLQSADSRCFSSQSAQSNWPTGVVALEHVGSSQARD